MTSYGMIYMQMVFVEVCDGGWSIVAVIILDLHQTNSAHNLNTPSCFNVLLHKGEYRSKYITGAILYSTVIHVVARWHHHL